MSRDLFINVDGANFQAQAVLAYLSGNEGIDGSWSETQYRYMAKPTVSRWENCREQGYVVILRSGRRQLNIAFFEHRNSDVICAVRWEQNTINAPTIETAEFGGIYKNKYDTSHSVGWGEAHKMADWIFNELTAFWASTVNDGMASSESEDEERSDDASTPGTANE